MKSLQETREIIGSGTLSNNTDNILGCYMLYMRSKIGCWKLTRAWQLCLVWKVPCAVDWFYNSVGNSNLYKDEGTVFIPESVVDTMKTFYNMKMFKMLYI